MVLVESSTRVLLNSSSDTESSPPSSLTMDSASRVGLDYIVENPDYVQKLASALESKNSSVKKQVFELLSALSVYSQEGYARTLQALDTFKSQIGERYKFKFLVAELQAESSSSSTEYKTSIVAFINCLILASPDAQERIRTRCEFIGLGLLQVLNELRHKHRDNPALVIQLDVFDEQRESDESQQRLDLASPIEVFDAILRQIAGTPQEMPFLSILQHLLSIDNKEPISDLIWDAAERLVHRATLVESREDAMRLLKTPTQAKSLQKLKSVEPNTCANCHNVSRNDEEMKKSRKNGMTSGTDSSSPGLVSPSPSTCEKNIEQESKLAGMGAIPTPPAPPPPPLMLGVPPPPPQNSSISLPKQQQNLPKLPQQAIPAPKAKMKTINWNKIPNGQILSNKGQNLWTTFSKKQANLSLDWKELEGLFCLQSEGVKPGFIAGGPFGGSCSIATPNSLSSAAVNELLDKNSRREPFSGGTGELILLDAKRSLNVNIFLKQFRSLNQDIIHLILNGKSQEFGSEKLRGLLKLLPTSDEIEMLNLISAADKSRLGSAEKFLLSLIQIDNYRLRIEAMLLREELENSIGHIDGAIGTIVQAAQDTKNSEQFQQVVFMILVAGNFLNSGGYAGDAAGVKLSSLQKIGDIRGNKPGISLLNFIVMQAEVRDAKLVSFVNDMASLEEASKISIEQLKNEITSLRNKVQNLSAQLKQQKNQSPILKQYGEFFKEAEVKIGAVEYYFESVESARVDLASFFCEEVSTFKIEDCFKIIASFIKKWRDAANENAKRKKHEAEAESRRKAREEQLKKRSQLGLPTMQLSNEDVRNVKGVALNPDDDLFIACSPRIVRRRLGSLSGHDNMSSGSTQGSNDQLTLPSPDITPNGSLRKRRSRLSSEEDESNLMDFLRSSGGNNTPTGTGGGPAVIGSPSMPRKLPGAIIDNQYGSLDRSWSRGRRRPNLLDFVTSDRERPTSPAMAPKASPADCTSPQVGNTVGTGGTAGVANDAATGSGTENKHDSPAREWRERITAWFVDLENGGSGDQPKRRPPPRRFQSRLIGDSVSQTSRGLATLPEVETNPDEQTSASTATVPTNNCQQQQPVPSSTYQRVYPDRKPSLKVNTDVVSAMEAIEEAQSPSKEKGLWRTSTISSSPGTDTNVQTPSKQSSNISSDLARRNLISSLGNAKDENLTLYIPPENLKKTTATGNESPEVHESEFGTKEGFDRFASIRRSRRIKNSGSANGSDFNGRPTSFGRAPPGPDTPIPTRRFVSKVDIGEDNNTHNVSNSNSVSKVNEATLYRRNAAAPRPSQRNGVRSSSLIDSKHVDSALNTKSRPSSNSTTTSSFISIPNTKTSTGTTTLTPLSSSPAEKDEGFDESPNSLTETNNIANEGSVVLVNKLQSQNNNVKIPVESVVTPKTIQRSNGSYTQKKALTSSNTNNVVAVQNRKNQVLALRNGTSTDISNSNNNESTTKQPNSNTKSKTQRILSFMRPTASSSAKDKLDNVVSTKPPAKINLINRRAFK